VTRSATNASPTSNNNKLTAESGAAKRSGGKHQSVSIGIYLVTAKEFIGTALELFLIMRYHQESSNLF
jgi:hypothetical protein